MLNHIFGMKIVRGLFVISYFTIEFRIENRVIKLDTQGLCMSSSNLDYFGYQK